MCNDIEDILSMLFFGSLTATIHKYQKIAALIEQRLSYMKDVAQYKFKKHLSIEDHTQENKVILNSINKAEFLGLDKQSIKPFIVSQINTAKTMQYRYKLDCLAMSKMTVQYDNLAVIRLEISKLTDNIIELISKEIKNNGQIKNQIYSYINKIQLHHLKASDKKIICSSLKQISLKKKI